MNLKSVRTYVLLLALLTGIVFGFIGRAYARLGPIGSQPDDGDSNCTPEQNRTTVFAESWGYISPAGSAPVGSVVTAHRPDGTQVGCFLVNAADAYGLMRIYGADPNTPGAPGLQNGDRISFEINGVPVTDAVPQDSPPWDLTWNASRDDRQAYHVDLSAASCSRYDMDCDCDVDIVDIMRVVAHWNCSNGDACYDSKYDIDRDGDIDIVDIMQVAAHWNCTCDDACYWGNAGSASATSDGSIGHPYLLSTP